MRFPESSAEPVRRRIADTLDRLGIRIGYASAACGADVLFHECLRERGGECNVVLPFDRGEFLKTSVSFAGGSWVRRVERIVNREILANAEARARVMAFDDAVKSGAMALFGEKYGDSVRVMDIGSSRELCGGTHVARTGDIGFFKIVGEAGVAAGIRRVVASPEPKHIVEIDSIRRLVESGVCRPVASGRVDGHGLPCLGG